MREESKSNGQGTSMISYKLSVLTFVSADKERSHPFLLFQPTSCTGVSLTVNQLYSTHLKNPLLKLIRFF